MKHTVKFDQSFLIRKIKQVGITQKELSKLLNISQKSLYNKLNNHTYFYFHEIMKISEILNIKTELFDVYFFTEMAQ